MSLLHLIDTRESADRRHSVYDGRQCRPKIIALKQLKISFMLQQLWELCAIFQWRWVCYKYRCT